MLVNKKHFRTIWENSDQNVEVIDQRYLPHEFKIYSVHSVEEMAVVIKDMVIRGAGLIGASAGYGMALASKEAVLQTDPFNFLQRSAELLVETRPTAVNLQWAVQRQLKFLKEIAKEHLVEQAFKLAREIADEDANFCKSIGEHGFSLIEQLHEKHKRPINILTHCNAGWLAFVDYGSATAPIYEAFNRNIPIHVWVDETRPRNQGASLTAWELGEHGVPHTVIADNAGGHLMQHGQVDLVIVGSDRTTKTGDVANKIGTYLKALAADDNQIPFYVALPSSTIDWNMNDGVKSIEIEERSQDEIKWMSGKTKSGEITEVLLTPENSPAYNIGFDVTPSRLVRGLITERGICEANENSISKLFPEYSN